MKPWLCFLLLVLICSSCSNNKKAPPQPNDFSFSPNKIWAHRVNTFEELEKKHALFDGLEIDLLYSKAIRNFYVAHDPIDTLRNVTLTEWLEKNPNPEKNWYWLDMKNLNKKNAKEIAATLVDILNRYGIFYKTICENSNVKTLYVLKKEGLAVSYLIKRTDQYNVINRLVQHAGWKMIIKRNINYLKPDALSCTYSIHPLLDSSFPGENILY